MKDYNTMYLLNARKKQRKKKKINIRICYYVTTTRPVCISVQRRSNLPINRDSKSKYYDVPNNPNTITNSITRINQ